MTESKLRFPAEWEPQSAVMIAWPHGETDWGPRLSEVEPTYVALATAIIRFQPLLACVADPSLERRVRELLAAAGVDLSRLRTLVVPYDDTWLRDSGPISLIDDAGFRLLDFRFTGWGGKYQASRDDRLVEACFERQAFASRCTRHEIDFALEGGGIETDGRGTLLTTWRCLHERHPRLSREEIDACLRDSLRQQRVLWLEHGYLEGDDTDAHIDTLARFAPDDAIVYQSCDDPTDQHHAELAAMAAELAALRTLVGKPYRLLPLPWPRPIVDGGRRLAASYANYLIVNGAVLMPAYGDPADVAAAAVLARAYPNREIVPIPCRPLIWQNGSLHCVTMQLPAGVANV